MFEVRFSEDAERFCAAQFHTEQVLDSRMSQGFPSSGPMHINGVAEEAGPGKCSAAQGRLSRISVSATRAWLPLRTYITISQFL